MPDSGSPSDGQTSCIFCRVFGWSRDRALRQTRPGPGVDEGQPAAEAHARGGASRADLLAAVQERGTRDVYEAVEELCHDELVRYSAHPDDEIRETIVFGLVGCGPEDPRVIEVLLQLAQNPDVRARGYAVYNFVEAITADGPAIRAVLTSRLDDPDEGVRGDASVGIASSRFGGRKSWDTPGDHRTKQLETRTRPQRR
jgi:hypothetical protein